MWMGPKTISNQDSFLFVLRPRPKKQNKKKLCVVADGANCATKRQYISSIIGAEQFLACQVACLE